MAVDSGSADAVVEELFRSAAGRHDPHPRYRRLRELAPVHRSDCVRGWLLTGFDDCQAAIRDPRLQNRYAEAMDSRTPGWRSRPGLVWASQTLPNLEGAAHAGLRRRVNRWFTPRALEHLRPAVLALVDELLDDLAAGGGGELIEQLALPLPVGVIGGMLGVPRADLASLQSRIAALSTVFEIGARASLDAADAAMVDCAGYCAPGSCSPWRRPRGAARRCGWRPISP